MAAFVWIGSTDEIVPLAEATVPLAVPGVLFGETLFETMRLRDGRIFRLAQHIERLQRGVGGLGWGEAPSKALIGYGLRRLCSVVKGQRDVRIRMTVVRMHDEAGDGRDGEMDGERDGGIDGERGGGAGPDDETGDRAGGLQIFIQAMPYRPPSPELYASGVAARVTSVRLDGTAPWMQYKTAHRLPFRLAKAEADRVGAWEGLLLNTEGMLVDGTIANIHFVRNGRIHTPAIGTGALPGIARDVIREIAEQRDIPWESGHYAPGRLSGASEAFLTNALITVMPLVRVDGDVIGDGTPGPFTQALAQQYAERAEAEAEVVT